MGYFLSKFINHYLSKEAKILVLGLDAAGKTTILYSLKLNEIINTIPTIGFNVEQVEFGRLKMTMWDVGGQDKIRNLWKHYYSNADALIYVVDSADVDRMNLAADELHQVLSADELKNTVVLIFANKQDLPNALSVSEIASKMRVSQFGSHRQWNIQACSATSGTGLYEGLVSLSKMIDVQQKKAK